MPLPIRSHLAGLTAIALAGCSVDVFTYTTDRYGTTRSSHVRLGCHDTYDVYDRPDAGSLLVVTSPLTELIACEAGDPSPLPVRQRRVAAIFLAEKTDRPLCQITRETPVSERHREFNYRCPAPPPPRAAPAARR